MSDEPVIDCHKCADLQFARNLVAQMKEGRGRHNSNLSFRHASDEVRAYHAQRAVGVDMAAPGAEQTAFEEMHRGSWREVNAPRVIGRIGERVLRERWQNCEVGDAVPERDWYQAAEMAAQGVLHISMVVPITYQWAPTCCGESPDLPIYTTRHTDIERRSFERVRVQMTANGGRTFDDHYFWKRLS